MAAFAFEPCRLPESTRALRNEVRAFLAERLSEVPPAQRALTWMGSDRAFSREVGARGWIGMTWPRRYGGGERSALERYVVLEEMLAAGAPVGDPLGRRPAERAAPAPLRDGGAAARPAAAHLPRRARLLHRHERARLGIRSRVDPLAGRARRGAMDPLGHEGLDERCEDGRLHDRALPDRSASGGPPRGSLALPRRPPDARHLDPTDPGPHGKRPLLRGVLPGRARALRRAARRRGSRLDAGDGGARLRAQRPGTLPLLPSSARRAGPAPRTRRGRTRGGRARAPGRAARDAARDVDQRGGAPRGRAQPDARGVPREGRGRLLRAVAPRARALARRPRAAHRRGRERVPAGAGTAAPDRPVLLSARRHARDPARDHRARPRPSMSEMHAI